MMMMMMGGSNQLVTTQNEGGGSSGINKGGGEVGLTLKKGPWTATEDAVLAEYVRTHGEGNWNAVQKKTGLARCGKSCRLRWANHLRPDLKKGAFSPEEERVIVELHAKMGNKWARMATQLPGRTDNEIKNYWNTRVKRKQRQGLPLYPSGIQLLYSQHHSQPATPILSPATIATSSFSFQTLSSHHHSSMPTTMHPLHVPYSASQPDLLYNPNLSLASTPPHVTTLQSSHKHAFSSTLPLFDSSTSNPSNNNTTTTTATSTSPSDLFFSRASPSLESPIRSYKRLRHDCVENNNNNHDIAVNGSNNTNSSLMFPFSSLLHNGYFNLVTTNASSLTLPHCPSYLSDPMTLDLASSSRILHPHFDLGQFLSTPGLVHPLKMELPSSQLLSQDGNPKVPLDTKGNNYGNNDHDDNHQNFSMPISGSGLLDDMLEKAQVLAGSNDILSRQSCLAGFSSSSEGLTSELKAKEETPNHGEDYSRLLNEIPSTMPMPEWFNDSREGSNGLTDDNLGLEMHHITSLLPVNIAAGHGRNPSSQSWDNLPGFC